MNKGLFITFEGNDGSGKTTISKNIYEKLKKMGYLALLPEFIFHGISSYLYKRTWRN